MNNGGFCAVDLLEAHLADLRLAPTATLLPPMAVGSILAAFGKPQWGFLSRREPASQQALEETHMPVHPISLMRFNILAAYTRKPSAFFVGDELEHFATDADRVLGVLIRDKADNDFSGLILGKDESRQYRAVHLLGFTEVLADARAELLSSLERWHGLPDNEFFQGDSPRPLLDVFTPIVPGLRLNQAFLGVAHEIGFTASRRVIESMMPFFQDIDGNFIEQFQTTAFDARIWELYLFAALTERRILFDRRYSAPDYCCDYLGYDFVVEATTVNPTVRNGVVVEPDPHSMDKERLKSYFTDYMPIKWGSALCSKLRMRYWELPHVAGKPLVLAVQDFHFPQSMAFSSGTLLPYLYGCKFSALFDARGTLVVSSTERTQHTWEGKTIPSGFFKLDGAEYVSAVISNPLGTVSKFGSGRESDKRRILSGF